MRHCWRPTSCWLSSAVDGTYDQARALLGHADSHPFEDMSMEKHFGNSGLFKAASYHCNNSLVSGIARWELKNIALNTKEFLICPKNYSEFLL